MMSAWEWTKPTYFDYIRAGAADEESFLEEFCCTPADDASAFLTFELLDACKYRPAKSGKCHWTNCATCTDPLYLGGDIARVKDFTVFWVIRIVGGVRLTVHRVALRNTPFDEQERVLYELLSLPTLRRACIDNSGLGRQLIERAQKRFGAYKVEPVTFTLATKEATRISVEGKVRRSLRPNP